MNRTLLLVRFSILTALFICAALCRPSSATAQYMYLDTNGDGIHTDADVLKPSGTTTIAVWLDTQHDKDGTLQTCNSHTHAPHDWSWEGAPPDPGLDIFCYDIYLVVTDGTVTWGDYEDNLGYDDLSPPDGKGNPTKLHLTYFIPTGEYGNPAGLHKLGEITATVEFGTPSIGFAPMVGWDYTAFGTHCSASLDYPNSYLYGIDWFDADGAPYGGPMNHPPSMGPLAAVSLVEEAAADVNVVATDTDAQPLTFTKSSGPDYVTVETVDAPGGAGRVHVAPQSADVGAGSATIRVSDGIFWCERTLDIVVRPLLRMSQPGDIATLVGGPVRYSIPVENNTGHTLSFSLVSAPRFVTLDARGTVSGLPAREDIGTWSVTVSVTDGTLHDQKTFRIQVSPAPEAPNSAPVAVTEAPFRGILGRPVLFDASKSRDPDGDPLSYLWEFGDGTAAMTAKATHAYTRTGDWTVSLTVRDPSVAVTVTSVAHIQDRAEARAYLEGGPGAALAASAGKNVCVRIEPLNASFGCAELGPEALNVTLAAAGAGRINAIGVAENNGTDADGNRIADRGILFSATDMAGFLSRATGKDLNLTLEGSLDGGGSFTAPLQISLLRHAGPLGAGMSPNPMNPSSQFSFVTTRAGRVDLRLYDSQGRLVRRVIDGEAMPAGYHQMTIDGRGDRGQRLSSGIYYYWIETPEGSTRGRFAILR